MFNLEALCSILEYASPTHQDNGVRSRSRSRLRARFPLRSRSRFPLRSRSRSRLGARAIFVVPVYAKTRDIISSRLWICWQCAKPISAPKPP